MIATAFRCSVQSEHRGDSMLGTAPPQTRVLLVHQPGPWGPRGFVESRCDPHVARRIEAAAGAAGMRLQAIRRPGKHEVGTPAGGFRIGIADTRADAATVAWWYVEDYAEVARDFEAGGPTRPPDAIDTAPLYLVCCHGRHDPCCALRGRPVAQALERERPGRVWETTHLGGDRFAANVLVLPSGDLYGHVPAEIASDFVRRCDAGDVVPALMRGRIGLAPLAQAALAYAHGRLGVLARNALAVTSIEHVATGVARATVSTPRGPVVVTLAADVSEPAQLTCRGAGTARAREYRGVSLEDVARA